MKRVRCINYGKKDTEYTQVTLRAIFGAINAAEGADLPELARRLRHEAAELAYAHLTLQNYIDEAKYMGWEFDRRGLSEAAAARRDISDTLGICLKAIKERIG